jgi:hypothetical protein
MGSIDAPQRMLVLKDLKDLSWHTGRTSLWVPFFVTGPARASSVVVNLHIISQAANMLQQ